MVDAKSLDHAFVPIHSWKACRDQFKAWQPSSPPFIKRMQFDPTEKAFCSTSVLFSWEVDYFLIFLKNCFTLMLQLSFPKAPCYSPRTTRPCAWTKVKADSLPGPWWLERRLPMPPGRWLLARLSDTLCRQVRPVFGKICLCQSMYYFL